MMPTPTGTLKAWSYSRYADYQRCPLFFKLKYLDKSIVDEGSAAMQRGNTIHKLAEDYATGKLKKLPPELKNFKEEFAQLRALKPICEQQWGFRQDWAWTGRNDWFGNDVQLRSKFDVAVVYDDNTGEVIDHKTGRKYGTNTEQVELFGSLAFMRFPQLTDVTIRLWYLDIADKNEKTEEFDMSAAEAVKIRKAWDKKVVPMFVDKRFAPKPNDRCKWCPASKDKGGPCQF